MKRLLFLTGAVMIAMVGNTVIPALAQDLDTTLLTFRQPRYKIEAIGFQDDLIGQEVVSITGKELVEMMPEVTTPSWAA